MNWLQLIIWCGIHWKWFVTGAAIFILSYIGLALLAWKGWYHG